MKIPQKEQKILQEIEYLQDRYFTFDEPVPFCGLFLHPIKVRNYNEFLVGNACFLLNKNDDPLGIKQSHLGYLFNKLISPEEGQMWSVRFSRLLELAFQIKNGLKCSKCGAFLTFEELSKRYMDFGKEQGQAIRILQCPNHDETHCDGILKEVINFKKNKDGKQILSVDGHEISGDDFMRLRKIVLYQNLPDFKDDSWVNKEVRDDQKAKQELLSKDMGTASVEKKIVSIAAVTSYKVEELYDMPIRKFLMLLTTIDDVITYATNRIGSMNGFVKMKNPIEHWIYKKDKGIYSKAVDAQAFKNTITSV